MYETWVLTATGKSQLLGADMIRNKPLRHNQLLKNKEYEIEVQAYKNVIDEENIAPPYGGSIYGLDGFSFPILNSPKD